ncbi:hypothetical protein BpHYR1_044191 [Brachionus plicatilis]|uniref:Uncharacterized protein n=1 Tax=Brachionus plicatilis TaxID=10195 RepID=A0A3M7PAS2_BRAPC|nr:hypothetical protein BpHYR1_044191 [Brachionus plicatilis]
MIIEREKDWNFSFYGLAICACPNESVIFWTAYCSLLLFPNNYCLQINIQLRKASLNGDLCHWDDPWEWKHFVYFALKVVLTEN